jgi:hypothetical protein
MKNIPISFILATSIVACTPSAPADSANTDTEQKAAVAVAFVDENDSCKDVKYLFDALPKLETYQGYNLESVGCSGHMIVAQYKSPQFKNDEIKIFLHEETGENKQNFNMTKMPFELLGAAKVNGMDFSDLKTFENASMNIKNTAEYSDVAYLGTYKTNYSFNASIRGQNLKSKQAVDAFIKAYLETIDLAKLP